MQAVKFHSTSLIQNAYFEHIRASAAKWPILIENGIKTSNPNIEKRKTRNLIQKSIKTSNPNPQKCKNQQP